MKKERLDKILMSRGIAQSRERAKAMIMTGKVLVDNRPVDKPGTLVDPGVAIDYKGEVLPYVSRAGLKLEAALGAFDVDVTDLVCMDVGASTGGFTDCLLQNGAKRVFAVDVGYGQLAWKLRQDPRVIPIERANIRYLTDEKVPVPIDLVTIDVSFISLRIVVPSVLKFLTSTANILTLIKPQFEVGKGMVGKGGIVRNPEHHEAVLEDLTVFFKGNNLTRKGVIPSPVLGAKGNREFMMHLSREVD